MECVYIYTMGYHVAMKNYVVEPYFFKVWFEKEQYQNQLGVPIKITDSWILVQTYWFRVSVVKN